MVTKCVAIEPTTEELVKIMLNKIEILSNCLKFLFPQFASHVFALYSYIIDIIVKKIYKSFCFHGRTAYLHHYTITQLFNQNAKKPHHHVIRRTNRFEHINRYFLYR